MTKEGFLRWELPDWFQGYAVGQEDAAVRSNVEGLCYLKVRVYELASYRTSRHFGIRFVFWGFEFGRLA